jgi:hypothetical protein
VIESDRSPQRVYPALQVTRSIQGLEAPPETPSAPIFPAPSWSNIFRECLTSQYRDRPHLLTTALDRAPLKKSVIIVAIGPLASVRPCAVPGEEQIPDDAAIANSSMARASSSPRLCHQTKQRGGSDELSWVADTGVSTMSFNRGAGPGVWVAVSATNAGSRYRVLKSPRPPPEPKASRRGCPARDQAQ